MPPPPAKREPHIAVKAIAALLFGLTAIFLASLLVWLILFIVSNLPTI